MAATKLEIRGNELAMPLLAREDKNGDEYFVAHPQDVSFSIDLSKYVVFFFPPSEGKNAGKLLFRPAKPEEMDKEG